MEIEDKWYAPGVFRLFCIPKNKAFFGQGEDLLFNVLNLRKDIESGSHPNKDLVRDFDEYGSENFRVDCVATGEECRSLSHRKILVENFRKAWAGDLY